MQTAILPEADIRIQHVKGLSVIEQKVIFIL